MNSWLPKEPYGLEFNEELKRRIRDRDGRVCQFCERTEKENLKKYGNKLDVHHIDYDKSHNDDSNLVSLCRSCHSKTSFDKPFWRIFYRKLVERKLSESVILDADSSVSI